MARNFFLRSRRTQMRFFASCSNSTQAPRYGMILAMKKPLVSAWRKNTPGERWSWLTTTRSMPLKMKVPFSVMSGMSPK